MRMRGHTTDTFPCDRRYEPYIERLGLLPFVLQFKRHPPPLNHGALTALIERWRPETHSFHFPCGEMTMTLEDMAMITALPIEGGSLASVVINPASMRATLGELIGVQPDAPGENESFTEKVQHTWITDNRGVVCPEGAPDEVVEQYARAYLWYLLTKVVFPDSTGNNAQWIYVELLRDWDHQYSWSSGALAYLYRQLDEACCRKSGGSSMGGFVWALQVWMWMRMPVGRPTHKPRSTTRGWVAHEGENGEDPMRCPPYAYAWDHVEVYVGRSTIRYKCYINEMDALTPDQIPAT